MKPKVCVSMPQDDGKPSKEVLGGGSLFSNVSSVGNGLTNGFDCCNDVLSTRPPRASATIGMKSMPADRRAGEAGGQFALNPTLKRMTLGEGCLCHS